MPIKANRLPVRLYGSTVDVTVQGIEVEQVVDADGASVVDFFLDGRSVGWDYDGGTTDRVEIVAENGDAVTLSRVGDYWRWTVTPDDLRGPTTAPGSSVTVYANVVVSRTTAGSTVSNAPTRWASGRFAVTLNRKAGFSPDHVSGLVLWLDAYDVTEAAGATVQTWDDKSVRDRDAAQASAGLRPTRQADGTGRPYLLFDGSDDVLATSWAQFGDPCTVFVAGFIDTADATVRGIVQVGGTNGARLAFDNSNLKGISGSDVANTTLPALDTPFVGTVSKATAGAVTVQLNLVTAVSQASTAAVTDGTVQIADTAADSAAACGVYEVVVYDSVLSAENQARVQRYLMKKWGVS